MLRFIRSGIKSILPLRIANALSVPLTFEQHFELHGRELVSRVMTASGMVVQSGPFCGMKLIDCWGPLGAKLLGTYETEISSFLLAAAKNDPDITINVGCAEGYYAVGLARLIPSTIVYAFDVIEAAQGRCTELANVNNVSDRLNIRGECTPAVLMRVLSAHQRALILMDCEGAERDLLTGEAGFSNATIIVECHDFLDPAITPDLVNKFRRTHHIQQIQQSGRNPHAIPMLQSWSENDRWIIVGEGRGPPMHWLCMVPRDTR